MKTLACVYSDQSVGCTFIDWSLHFLSGQTNFYNAREKTLLPLTTNPLNNTSAHNHIKNHPDGVIDTQDYFEKFLNSGCGKDFFSVYAGPLLTCKAKKKLAIDTINSDTFKTIRDCQNKDTLDLFDWCATSDVRLIYISSVGLSPLYFLNTRYVGHFLSKTEKASSRQELNSELDELFYHKSVSTWKSLNLNDIWDVRERMALDWRPFNTNSHIVGTSHKHLRLHCQDVWTKKQCVMEMLDYLELTVDRERLATWQQIYKQWQSIQFNHLKFEYYFEDIVNSIVNDWYLNIDLTFSEEVVIQHALIYRHGLNLKTWGLIKFPGNTQELHRLLEPNLHPVELIY